MSTATSDAEKGTRHHEDFASSSPTPVAPALPQYRQFANPTPLGLCSFALTTFVLSLVYGTSSSSTFLLPMNLLFLNSQLLAGLGEFFVGNTFGATAFSSYGAFWLSYAAILVPSFNVAAPYSAASSSPEEFKTAISFFLFGWFIFTFLMLLAMLKHSVAFVFLFTTLDMAFLTLALGEYFAKEALIKAGGVFGLLSAFSAWYCTLALILNKDNSFFTVSIVPFQKRDT
ncbi:hypothetical protein FRC19_010909 [Serendipita sp. 401]|nr:hypothetical protein FRC19_010909 [Serendipita sp. 401]